MFSFFKSKPKMPEISDKIWMTEAARKKGFIQDVELYLQQDPQVKTAAYNPTVLDGDFTSSQSKICILYFFEDTKNYLSSVFKDKKSLEIISALEFAKSDRLQFNLRESIAKGNYQILFAEHYPLARVEKPILEKIATLDEHTVKVCFYTSLDNPIMTAFGGDRITNLMKQLGMQEDDVLQHQMISTSFQKAQEKLDAKVKNEQKADSEKEWFARNVK